MAMKKLFAVAFSTLISYGTFAQDSTTVDSSATNYSVTTRTVTTTTYGYDQNSSSNSNSTNTNNYKANDDTWDPFFRFGIKAGANLSNIRGNDLSLSNNGTAFNFRDMSDRAFGFVGGVFMRFGRDFYVQPEILLSQKGGKFSVYENGVTDPSGNVDVRFTNLDVPLLLGVRIAKTFRINAGPVATFRMSDNGKISDSFRQYTGDNTQEVLDNRTAFGYQAGVGFDFGRLSLDVRYEGNFNDVVNIQYGNQQTQSQFGRKSNLWQASLGFALF
jgi:hypothetical protein